MTTAETNRTLGETLAGKYLSFFLAKEEYGIQILRVREIIGIVDITPLPRTPEFVKGVVNLRGKIIPVVDLRAKFGMAGAAYGAETCIVVVDLRSDVDGSVVQMGCVVDTVSEVLDVRAEQVEEAPPCARANSDFLLGLGKCKDKVLILLDIDRILTTLELATLHAGQRTAPQVGG